MPIILLLCHLDVGIFNGSFIVSGTEPSRAKGYDLLFPKGTQARPELHVGVCVDEGINYQLVNMKSPVAAYRWQSKETVLRPWAYLRLLLASEVISLRTDRCRVPRRRSATTVQ